MDNAASELAHLISHQVQDQLKQAIGSPELINRTIGEAMRHIGTVMTVSSSSYLPLRDEEVLVKPMKWADDCDDAFALITRTTNTSNSFMLLVNRQIINGAVNFVLFAYKADDFNLAKTKFFNFDEVTTNELTRQLGQIIKEDCSILVQCVILKDYFKNKTVETNELFSSDVEKTEPQEPALTKQPVTTKVETSMLPAVNPDALL